ncbi:hypothetical protein [Aphanothece sacrum]|uniref:Serine/threonine protein kinase n=1 Tax=Aphanothece sacrum FPU1 TaxID=1920663 RepID=A0A401IHL1_APHSA|nr:hypothetical protein [Aphanothece sacrum]GBF80690.1 serine/threonine protein kinase [Aphanothece sacrum FPU1]GBF83184.1 serine/threonine protein kinase [Aphanothece sacrum FPU3]
MKIISYTIAALLTTLPVNVATQAIAKDPPAATYQPGFWQPIARFNTKKPVEIKLINNTTIPLEYDLTGVEIITPETLAPGNTSTLKNFGDSAYIVVYYQTPVDVDNPFTLKFNVNVSDNNVVTVTIEKAEPSFFGHRAINLQQNGAIYFY